MQGSIDFDILWPTGISEPMPWGGDVFFNFAKYFTSSSPLYDYQSGAPKTRIHVHVHM